MRFMLVNTNILFFLNIKKKKSIGNFLLLTNYPKYQLATRSNLLSKTILIFLNLNILSTTYRVHGHKNK